MSSGLGLKGNVSRCYQYFEDFAVCMVRAAFVVCSRLCRTEQPVHA